jgi:hypothetical protein
MLPIETVIYIIHDTYTDEKILREQTDHPKPEIDFVSIFLIPP